jgi:hypothetical protein
VLCNFLPKLRRPSRGAGFWSQTMTEDADEVDSAVMVLADQFGRAAARLVLDYAEAVDALPDMPLAEMWHEIAAAIERLSSKP